MHKKQKNEYNVLNSYVKYKVNEIENVNWKWWWQYSYDIINFLAILIMDILINCILIKKMRVYIEIKIFT